MFKRSNKLLLYFFTFKKRLKSHLFYVAYELYNNFYIFSTCLLLCILCTVIICTVLLATAQCTRFLY